MEEFHREVIDGVTYVLLAEEDWIPRGHIFFKGEDELNADIKSRLLEGDIWAWASVEVQAQIEIGGILFAGHSEDCVGGCNYKDAEDFVKNGDYYEEMKETAYADLLEILRKVSAGIQEIQPMLEVTK